MKPERPKARQSGALRQRAKERLRKRKGKARPPSAEEDVRRLLHELEVHQVELEMQNEELRRANLEAEETLRKYSDLYDFAPIGYFTFDRQGKILEVNLTGAQLLGQERSHLLNRRFQLWVEPGRRPAFNDFCGRTLETETRQTCEVKILRQGKPFLYAEIEGVATEAGQGKGKHCRAAILDITERKKMEETAQQALKESQQHQTEISALLESSRAVLEFQEFKNAARSIFDSCKKIIGAPSGYIALLSKDGSENELLFLDSGGLPCTVDPNLPMPIRGMRQEAYHTGKAVYHNDFAKSKWTKYLPKGHVTLENVLFAPLRIKGEVVGLLGLANKPGGFTPNDARLAAAFSEHAAIALYNSRALETLENSEERFRSVVQTAADAIISVDSLGKVTFWNPGAEKIFGYRAGEVAGQPLSLIIPPSFHERHQQGMNRVAAGGESMAIGKTMELLGRRKGGGEFPMELSLSAWKTGEGSFFTGIIRDITERKQMEKALRQANEELESRVQERTAELREANEALHMEIEERKQAEESLRKSEKQLKYLSSQLLTAQENERRRIARELHDGLGQTLSAAKFSLERKLGQMGNSQPPPGISLEEIIPILQEGIAEVRRISSGLWPSILDDLGILTTISWFCRQFQTIYSNIHVEKQVSIGEEEVPPPLKSAIYRIMQEALNNIAKYSRANLVQVSLRKVKDLIELVVQDNGIGFDLKNSQKSLGLASMKERTELAGGSFAIHSAPGEGTEVRATWKVEGMAQ